MEYTQEDIEKNLGLVHFIAQRNSHRLRHRLSEYDDLISDGVLGLCHALGRFEPARGVKFSSYAYTCIWGYMVHGRRNLHMEEYKAFHSRFEVPAKTVSLYSGDSVPGESTSGEESKGQFIRGVDDGGRQAEEMEENALWGRHLPQVWDLCDERERLILKLRFGVGEKEPMTLQKIGDRLGLTRERVRQIQDAAIKKVREHLQKAVRVAA